MSIQTMKQAFKNIYGHEPQEDSFLWAGFQDGYKAAIEATERQEPVCDLGTTRIGDTWYRTQGGYLMGEIPTQPASAWQPIDVPLYYKTRCADGTIFMNAVQMPAHAIEWCIAAPPEVQK